MLVKDGSACPSLLHTVLNSALTFAFPTLQERRLDSIPDADDPRHNIGVPIGVTPPPALPLDSTGLTI